MLKSKTKTTLTNRSKSSSQMTSRVQNGGKNKSKSISKSASSKYRTVQYAIDDNNGSNSDFILTVENIPIHSRGLSNGTHYFECASHRRRNQPTCNFRGRIVGFDPSITQGWIEIIADHSPTCKFLPGNDVHDFNKNPHLNPNRKIYQNMKIQIEKKLESENWLTPGEVETWMKAEFPIENHFSYQQIHEIVQNWRQNNNAYKESYIFQHSVNKVGLPFFRAYFITNYKKNGVNKCAKVAI